MATSAIFLLALVGAIGLANCQFDRDVRDQDRDRQLGSRRPDGNCVGKVMDIFFVMDSSSSIYIHDYMNQHRLVYEIVSRFDVSEEATRVGMLTFSDDLERPIMGLDQYSTKGELLDSISLQSLPYRTGVTNTDMAIRYVRQLNNFRRDITKVMVVMTDGGSRSPGSTAREAELSRNSGFYMYVMGIGQYIEEAEWRSISSDPYDSFVFNITNPRIMEDAQFSFARRACALPPIVLGGSCDVNRMSELYFVASRSTQERAQELIESFGRRTRDQGDLLRVNYFIDRCSNLEDMQLLRSDPFICERFDRNGNPIATAGTDEMFSRAARAIREDNEPSTNHVIVLFIDDQTMSVDRFQLNSMARSAKNDGVTVVVADLGTRTFRDFALSIASGRNNFITFSSGSLVGQSNSLRTILDSVCSAANDVPGVGPAPNFRADVV